MERGESPYSMRQDRPIKIGNWSPQNYDGGYHGAMPLISAFARSINTIAVGLGEEAGRDNVVRVARRLGIRSRLDPQVTLALGTEVLTPIELTAAYVPFSNGGAAVTPYGFKRIRTRSGTIVWERHTPQPRRVVEDTALRNMNLMFRQVVQAGTAKGAALGDRMVGGKTGTTSDYRDAWFIGFTAGYTTGVWVGNDDFGIKMNKVTGGTAPTRIWHEFMQGAMQGTPARAFLLPAQPINSPATQVFAPQPSTDAAQTIDSPAVIGEGTGGAVAVDDAPVTGQTSEAPNGETAAATPEAQAIEPNVETRSLDQIVKDVVNDKPKNK